MTPMRRALQIILGLALLGVAFSGTLTYRELCGTPRPAAPSSVDPAPSSVCRCASTA
jgi:hypothetical protein